MTQAVTPAHRLEPRLLAIASGKGGVGKTWLAITLAHALARAGQAVLLFDADLGLANIDVQLGLLPAHNLSAVIAGRLPLTEAIIRHAPTGIDILAGRSGAGSLGSLDDPTLDRLLGALRAAAAAYDAVVLDLGAGIDRAVRRLASAATDLLVVATDEPTSLTDAYAVLKLHAADGGGGPASIIVNQATSLAEGQRTYAALARACRTFIGRDPPLAGIIRRDLHVRDAIRRQMPLLTRHPTCQAAMDVEAIAEKVKSGKEAVLF